MILTLLVVVYVVCVVMLACFATGTIFLLAAYWRHRHDYIATPTIDNLPAVAIQLPIYNERYVVERLLEAVARLDYPHDRLLVQILDDSTDDTSALIADLVVDLRAAGLQIEHIQRGNRAGYKAGALAYGLALLTCEYVAVLDADFVPQPDFLLRTVPHLVTNPRLALVQGRWGHLNSFGNLITIVQTLALDSHFVVEQTGRNRSGWLMNFNGSGGIWRVRAIHDAGGWQDTTLTEDLDLSYRAQLKGWRFLYLPDVVVPGELPPQLAAYKQQQARWAKGGTQCLAMLLPLVWRTPGLTLLQRLMATMHLSQYMNAPLIILILLLTPILLIARADMDIPLGPLGLVGLFPPLMLIVSQQALYHDWQLRTLALPASIMLATGMTWNNSVAVIGGLLGGKTEFKRTPKFANAGNNRYSLRGSRTILVEAALAVYALFGALVALRVYPALVPYLVIYSIAFGAVALWGVGDLVHLRQWARGWSRA